MSRSMPAVLPLVAAIASVMSGAALAKSSEPTETMVVTAAGYEQLQADAPASISVISRSDLEKRYYRDVTDALRDVSGVVITGGGDTTDISLRGMGSKYTLILVDGKRQSSRETRPNSDGPGIEQGWLPPLQAIERIEVIRGPMSTLYGSDAIGGVINVITRKVSQEWAGNVQIDTVIQEDSHSGDQRSANFFLNGPLVNDKLGLQLYGQTTQRDEDNIAQGFEDKSLNSVTGRLNYQVNESNLIQFEAGVSEQDRRGNVGLSVPTTGCRGECEDSLNEYRRTHYALTHQGNWDALSTDAYVQHEISTNKSRQMEIANTTAKASMFMPLGSHLLTLGAEVSHASLDDESSNKAKNSSRTHISNTQMAAFIEDEWGLTETFSLTLGGRLDHDENYGDHISPRVYGVWHFAEDWTLKGGVSTGFRSPQLREITADWAQVSRGGNIYGNPDLEPEKSVNKEIGLLYSNLDGLTAGLTLFHNDFDDKITRVVCPDTVCTSGPNQWGSDPTYRVNVDEAITRGVEASLMAPLTDTLTMNASYTYTDSEQKTGKYKGQPLNQLPEHLANAGLDWLMNDTTSSWLKVTYRGEESQPVTTPSSSTFVAPSSTFVDAGLTYQLTENTRVKAAIYNLLDESITYEEYQYVEDGRRYWLGMDVAF
ncbi:ligand-gated channel protein [Photobacterium sp. TY1-4]|uniref:ligand-gated channel protein n=1 Tax=Photobacterium sp. TY1-4 TaxID=2899122 RepID=UPI0021C0E7F0|nr:ligand-gated channel protein [Photobacterium sp. TY1-4]UXI03054.1 ligand-gated channel protein [Photobacterium sp. TY1-4]